MLGETVERAFRLMQTATKVYGKIFCDYDTKADANHMLDFIYLEHIQFPDKYLNCPVFQPLDPSLEAPQLSLKRKRYILSQSSV